MCPDKKPVLGLILEKCAEEISVPEEILKRLMEKLIKSID